MAEAYATLANHGRHGAYTLIDKVTKDGKDVVELPGRKTSQVVSREAADTTTSILRSVVQNGTATAAQAVGRPAAGKTGTAEKDTAAWFAGYTPDLATVVAVMGQDPVTAAHKPLYGAMGLQRINGGGAPTEIWAQFTRKALKDTPAHDFNLQLQEGSEETAYPSGEPSESSPTGDQETSATPSGRASQGQGDQGRTQGQTGGGGSHGGTTTGGGTDGGPGTGGTTSSPTGGATAGATTSGDTSGGDTGNTTGSTSGDTGGATGSTPSSTGTTGAILPQGTARRE